MATSEILTHLVALVVGILGGSFLTLKIERRSNRIARGGKMVDQSGSKVSGDQTGGNKTHR